MVHFKNICISTDIVSRVFHILTEPLKLAFHGADTDPDILADFRARIVHEPDTHEDPRRLVRQPARFSSRGCPLGMRTCTRVQYTISYLVHVYKITR